MMDAYAFRQYKRYFGAEALKTLYPAWQQGKMPIG